MYSDEEPKELYSKAIQIAENHLQYGDVQSAKTQAAEARRIWKLSKKNGGTITPAPVRKIDQKIRDIESDIENQKRKNSSQEPENEIDKWFAEMQQQYIQKYSVAKIKEGDEDWFFAYDPKIAEKGIEKSHAAPKEIQLNAAHRLSELQAKLGKIHSAFYETEEAINRLSHWILESIRSGTYNEEIKAKEYAKKHMKQLCDYSKNWLGYGHIEESYKKALKDIEKISRATDTKQARLKTQEQAKEAYAFIAQELGINKTKEKQSDAILDNISDEVIIRIPEVHEARGVIQGFDEVKEWINTYKKWKHAEEPQKAILKEKVAQASKQLRT